MKSDAPFVLIAAAGVAEPVAASPRFAIHGDSENRLMFDCQTGETWNEINIADRRPVSFNVISFELN